MLVLTACGFHLRGAYKLPEQMQRTYVQAENQNSELIPYLKRALRSSGVQLAESPQQATAILHLSHESHNKRVISVDSQGRAREYELSYGVSFELSSDTDFAVKPQRLQLQKDFLFDPENVLGKDREEQMLIRDMQSDIVLQIMRKLAVKN
ncbi:MAG: LPS assembly lipoprotein LptE [Gammaproteobacteria bacterium]|nr:LPS assembly lipoprotein LptE [Gammaproteobacteria bacterium]